MSGLLKPLGLIATGLVFITACKVNKNSTSSNNNTQNVTGKTVTVKPPKAAVYRPTETRLLDEEYMNLAISFDYSKQHVHGKAVLRFRPYFYETKTAEIDARGFEIKRVALLKDIDSSELKYAYNGTKLLVFLDKVYTRNDKFELYIEYIAKPNELKSTKGIAITSDKGLYFINPTGKDKDKPRQIWSQGETQSNSAWFPTIDAPNEKITHDIAITVDDKDITLSNGELMMSKNNPDGTRTDHWKQNLPHAPYLVMIAVGEFAHVKDYWRDSVVVDYYVEQPFKQYAKMVFGNTPEMLEVFSKKLGVDYPWNKYSQIVVRDFVSGAMENTSAVIHYDALQHDHREHLDNPHEDIVAHELFHHWFGDLVTCESWSNIPLNESFATYGEYIWQEHKYGDLEADKEFYNNLYAYLASKNKHKAIPIRYHYGSRDDMFDVVSYQKGGYMLHMLRRQIGDEAFFAALKLYLKTNSYKTAELANLRMAFEEVTGQDLNWFFDQWFLKAGHPVLEYSYNYSTDRRKVTLTIKQKQESEWGIYRLPLKVDVYANGKSTREEILVKDAEQQFELNSSSSIDFINVDADQTLPAKISDGKTAGEFKAMIKAAPLYMDKHYAVKGWTDILGDTLSMDDIATVNYLLKHEFWGIRDLGLSMFEKIDSVQLLTFKAELVNIALHDSKSANRAEAIAILADNNAKEHKQVFESAMNDSSYMVVGSAIEALALIDFNTAKPYIEKAKLIKKRTVQYSVANILGETGSGDEVEFFEATFDAYGHYNYAFMSEYSKYLQLASKDVQLKAIPGLQKYYKESSDDNIKTLMPSFVRNMQSPWKDRLETLSEQRKKTSNKTGQPDEIDRKTEEAQRMIAAYDSITKP